MRWALIKNGIVDNVVEWDGQGDLFSDYLCINVDNITVGPGWSYDGENFHDDHPYLASPEVL